MATFRLHFRESRLFVKITCTQNQNIISTKKSIAYPQQLRITCICSIVTEYTKHSGMSLENALVKKECQRESHYSYGHFSCSDC